MSQHLPIRDLAEPAGACLLVAAIATMCHWRNWFRPQDAKLADGSPDPRAGGIDWKKVTGDFIFTPTLMVIGCLLVGLNIDFILILIGIAAGAFVGSSFLMATFEKLRDALVPAITTAITSWLPKKGGK